MTDEMTPQSPGQTGGAAADVEMSQYVAGRSRVNEDKIRQDDEIISQFGEYEYGWHDSDAAGEAAKKGIDENVVRAISADKGEPEWMLDIRLKGYQAFLDKPKQGPVILDIAVLSIFKIDRNNLLFCNAV